MPLDEEAQLAAARKIGLFTTLTERELEQVCDVTVMRTFDKGDMIVREQDKESPAFYVIISGSAHVCVISSAGKQSILATLCRGDFFGEMAILDGQPRSASVVAAEEAVLFIIYKKHFVDLLNRFPKISIQMVVEMSRRLRKSNSQINTLALVSVRDRVAEVLRRMAVEQGIRNGCITILPGRPTHQMIAEMAGTSRETVSRIMSEFQKEGAIRTEGRKLLVLDERLLGG